MSNGPPCTSFNLGSIADQFGHGTSPSDVVLKDMDKLFISFHGINITYHGFSTNKEFSVVTPPLIAGVSEYTVSVATSLFLWWTLQAGNGDLYLFFRYVPMGIQ